MSFSGTKTKPKMSQCQRVLARFLSGKTYTQAQARTHAIRSLSSQVNKLRRAGVLITSTPIVNRHTGRTVVRYGLTT